MGLRLAQKAAFAAVLAAALPCASANAATITATAKAKVVKPLALESRRNLDLGTIILGPGEAAKAHQTDEYCSVERIRQASDIYSKLAARWAGRSE